MPQLTFTMYFFALLALLPLYTWSIDFGMRKMLARDQILPHAERAIAMKRQTSVFNSASASGTCSTGYYLCPASLSGGCCPTGRACGLTDCPASTSGRLSGTSLSSASVSSSGGSSSSVCNAGYKLCPASVGGGCCLSAYTCDTSRCIAPATVASASNSGGQCSTGSYLCAASFSGGCCPTNRACGFTDCPTFATITSSDAIGTVGTDGTTRFCTTGSSLCPADVSYGCCRLGYSCGLTNCVPTSTGGAIIYSASTCGIGRFSCAASLGGGCCQSGLECGPTNCFVPSSATFLNTGTIDTARTGVVASETKTDATATSATGTGTRIPASGGTKKGLSGGAIGGIVGGVIGGLALIAAGIFAFCFAKKKRERNNTPAPVPAQPPMAHSQMPPPPPPAPVGGYYQPTTGNHGAYGGGYNQQPQPYDNRSSVGPSELGSDVGSGTAKPYGNQFGAMPENTVNEMPASGMAATHNFGPVHGAQVYEVDGSGAGR